MFVYSLIINSGVFVKEMIFHTTTNKTFIKFIGSILNEKDIMMPNFYYKGGSVAGQTGTYFFLLIPSASSLKTPKNI